MEKIKNIFSWDLCFLLFINLIVDSTSILPINFIILNKYIDNETFLTIICGTSVLVIDFLKLLILPFAYSFICKKSKNKFIIELIKKLKTSQFYRNFILFMCLIPLILWQLILFIFSDNNLFTIYFIIHAFVASLFCSYLVLFIYWNHKGELVDEE